VNQRTLQLQREIREREHAERQHTLEAARSRIARDLHDDLGATLTARKIIRLIADYSDIPARRKKYFVYQNFLCAADQFRKELRAHAAASAETRSPESTDIDAHNSYIRKLFQDRFDRTVSADLLHAGIICSA